MNPRLFCRERTYGKALFLTYSFDPTFFEQVVLPDLWAGRSGDIVVVGDRQQILDATQALAGQLWHLGKHYLLAGANHAGAFHPKVTLRLGAKDGAVMIGSGNLTSSGWGGSQELGAAWMLGPEHADDGSWLHEFLDDVTSWCSDELEVDAIRRMKDVPWLSLTARTNALPSPVLHSRPGQGLATALAQRWTGRQFDEVRVLTGSTDESGAFLRWAHATFGIKRAVVAMTPAMSSFRPERLADLPIELRLIPALPDKPMHAKFYWFDGPDGPAAVMGSANCSAAAWLVQPDRRGNVETVVVYDFPERERFVAVLDVFDATSYLPDELLAPAPTVSVEPLLASREFDLRGLRWDSESRHVFALIAPQPSPEVAVELLLGAKRFNMTPPDGAAGGYWTCELPDGIGATTTFASVHLRQGALSWTTSCRWINDVIALRHAALSARLLEPFKGFDGSVTSSEQRQMLDDLQEVARTLFNDSASFRDPGFGAGREPKKNEEAGAAPVNPNDLICHLEEPPDSLGRSGSGASSSLSLSGILRMLFDAEGDAPGVNPPGDGNGGDGSLNGGEDPPPDPKMKPKPDAAIQDRPPVEARFRERLAEQITTFLAEMSSIEFAGRCTATQMVQAASFPLAVALRGQGRGWVSSEHAEKWGLEVFSILFRGSAASSGGLLRAVEQRYAGHDQTSTFNDVVGDGTLWMVLVATLGKSRWEGICAFIDKAIALREVFMSPQLLGSAQAHRVAGLLGKIRIDDAQRYLAEVAPTVTRLLGQIEDALRPVWKGEASSQVSRRVPHKVGDLLWREAVGWAVCLVEFRGDGGQGISVRLRGLEKSISPGFYVNVTDLAARDPHLASLIRELRNAIHTTASE